MRHISAQIDAVCPVNWLHQLNRGLVSWWKCLPGWTGGRLWHDLCRRNHGFPANMNLAADWVSGADHLGGYGALRFDGVSKCVFLGNDRNTQIGPAITIAAWINFINMTSAFEGILVRTSVFAWEEAKFAFYLGSSGQGNNLKLQFIMEGQATPQTSAIQIPTSEWAYVAVSCSPAKTIFMIDGKIDPQSGVTGADPQYTTADFALVGAWVDTGEPVPGGPFTGPIDDVRLYERALSEFELTQLYRESTLSNPGTLNRVKRWFFPPSESDPPPEVNLVTARSLGLISMDESFGTPTDPPLDTCFGLTIQPPHLRHRCNNSRPTPACLQVLPR